MLRLNHYQYVGEIGKGTYGTIEVYKKNDQEYVVKRMNVNDSLSQVIREIEIYKKLQHPHVVRYIDHKYGTTSSLMLERGRCTLGSFISNGKYNLKMYHRWIYQTALALDYLHYHNLIHTDLKPANIIMFRGPDQEFYPKLCDLGCCQIHCSDQQMSCYIQTENYRSPEIKHYLDHKRYHGTYDHKIDVWSLGIIMVDLLCHQYSYGKINYYQSSKHLAAVEQFCQKQKYFAFPADLIPIIAGCLAHDPQDRWDCRQFLRQTYWNEVTGIKNDFTGNAGKVIEKDSELEKNANDLTATPSDGSLVEVSDLNTYQANNKSIFRYPIQDRRFLELFTEYYQELPERLVTEAYYLGLKIGKRNLKINQWRCHQYCLYILSLLYFNEPPGLFKSIFSFKNKEVFQILNASHDLILF